MVGLAQQSKGRTHDRVQRRVSDFRQRRVQRLGVAATWVGAPLFRQQLHQAVGRRFVQPVGFGGFTQGGTQPQRADGGDQRHAVGAVGLTHVVKHLVAAYATKVKIDVGQAAARRVEKTLEKQVMSDGIDGCDADTVGDQRVRHTATRGDGDVLTPCKADDVGHEQEEGCKAVSGDGSQFGVGAGGQLVPICVRCGVAGAQPGGRLRRQRVIRALLLGQRQHRPDRATIGQSRLTGSDNGVGGVQGSRKGGVTRCHLLWSKPVERNVVIAMIKAVFGAQRRQGGVAGDGGQQVQALAVAWLQAVDCLRRRHANAEARRQRCDRASNGCVLWPCGVDCQPGALAEDAGQPAHHAPRRRRFALAQQMVHPAAPPARQADQTCLVGFKLIPGQAGAEAADAGGRTLQQRGESAERAISCWATCQQGQFARRSVHGHAVGRRHCRGHADHRLHADRQARALKRHRAVEHVGVGQCQMRHAILSSTRGQRLDRGCSAK